MLIICPKCFSQYKISDEIIISNDQKCHCSACGNYFRPEAKKEEAVVEEKKIDIEQKIEEAMTLEREKIAETIKQEVQSTLFSEPLRTDDELKFDAVPLDIVPEEFKPVQHKKTSLFSALVWLSLGAGICFFAYTKKDYLFEKVDSFIVEKLQGTKTKEKSQNKKTTPVSKVKTIEKVDEKKNNFAGIEKTNSVPETQETDLMQNKKELAQELNKEILLLNRSIQEASEKERMQNEILKNNMNETDEIDYSQILSVQNISYEISLNEVGMERLLIKGVVLNTSLNRVSLPETKAVVYDDMDNVVARKRVLFTEKTIEGNSEISFETGVVPSPKSVSKVEVVFDE